MSVALMAKAFMVQGLDPTAKLVLLALCDHANDDGVCWPSVEKLAIKASVHPRSIQRWLVILEEKGFLDRTTRNGKSTIFTVAIRAVTPDARVTPDAGVTPPLTPVSPLPLTPASPRTINRNIKEPSTPPARVVDQSDADRFAKFWAAYPKRVGKLVAEKAFAKHKVTDELLAQMLAALAVQTKSKAWTKDAGEFIPNPSTYLNQRRWEDVSAAVPWDGTYRVNEYGAPHFGPLPAHIPSDWFVQAGFADRDDAVSAGCWPADWRKFSRGKRLREGA